MRGEIADLHARLGNTMIYVTHDQVEAMTMADKIAVLRAGRVEQFGKPLDLFNVPDNRFVAGFIGSPAMNFFKGQIEGDKVQLDCGGTHPLETKFAGTTGQQIELGVRAGDLKITTGEGLKVTVNSVEHLGAESYLYCQTSTQEAVTVHQLGQTEAVKGDTINLEFETSKMHVFDLETGQSCRT